MELLDIAKTNVYIPSCDMYGNTGWHNITHITRHDPSEYIYKIKTKWGRSVSVVASKSLLIWNETIKKFEEKNMEDVKIDDCVPITFNLEPISIIKNVDIRKYLSVDNYLYGTEYNNKYYKKIKKSFSVKNDNVYLKNSKQNSPPFLDKFEFNRENGFFIGIFLAEGNTCIDYVGIANNDPVIREKVGHWFEKNNIKHLTQVKKFNPKRPGLSTSIRGYSKLLVQFLDKFLGKYSHGKYVPLESYNAPDEFIKGIIDGYTSGDGSITKYHIVWSSVSQDLILGFQNLLNRFGIFTKLSSVQQKSNNVGSKNILRAYKLHVQSKYVYKFGELFTLTHPQKQEQLIKLTSKTTLDSMKFLYREEKDVILDNIISIEKIKSSENELYKKVYDITVPETLNFQLFNGMVVRDTSETGYIDWVLKSRRDVKN